METMAISPEREERRRRQKELADRLKASGAMDEIFAKIDAGEPLTGEMTIRDIQHHLASTIGTELSHETISKITDQVTEEVLAWQTRPLESLYPVIFLDAIIVKIRDGGHVRNKAAHIAVGVDMDGIKHVLGIWVQAIEGAKFWASVCAELACRRSRARGILGRGHSRALHRQGRLGHQARWNPSTTQPVPRHGAGKAVGHRGGEYIWKLADSWQATAHLLACWKTTTDDEVQPLETAMIDAFESRFGRWPFANRKHERRTAR